MFEGRKKQRVEVGTLIGRDSEVQGGITFKGGLHVDGRVVGNVAAPDDPAAVLTVGPGAQIEGDVRVPHVNLNGAVIGDVHSSETVELAANARVTGNIYYNRIEMAMGAEVNGQLIYASTKEKAAQDSETTATEHT